MRSWLEKMLGGERQVVFITGKAGIGKTALVETFSRSIASDRSIRIGQGPCLEQYGTSEAYLPVLEAIGRLCREQGQVVDVLRAYTPMWLLQMPSLVSASDRELLSREVLGATRERMLREMGEALEALAEELPLVLILEDLHWSDYSTLDLISYLARQRQPARLMLIGTYRPVELIVSGHPLKAVKRELLAKQQCEELPLEYLKGAEDEAIEQMRQGLAALQTTGTELVRPHFLALLAEALGRNRQAEEALRYLEEGLEVAHRNGDRSYLAELYRIKGDLLLIQATGRGFARAATGEGAVREAEPLIVAQAVGCFNQSIKIAQQQKANSWELRTVMRLARLYRGQGKQEEARDLLTQVYERFTEGFETADLQEAKALLDELS